jgi:hypothetical protein
MPLVLPRNQAFTQPFSLWLLHPSAFTGVQTNGCPHRLAVKQLRPSALWLLASHQSFTSRCAAHGCLSFILTGYEIQPSYNLKEFFKECHLGDALWRRITRWHLKKRTCVCLLTLTGQGPISSDDYAQGKRRLSQSNKGDWSSPFIFVTK